jgi:hypothetical protein
MKTLKLSIQTPAYKNEIRVDVSDLEDNEIESLANEAVKAMLNESKKLPEGKDE